MIDLTLIKEKRVRRCFSKHPFSEIERDKPIKKGKLKI